LSIDDIISLSFFLQEIKLFEIKNGLYW